VSVRYFPARVRRLYWSPPMRRALRNGTGEFDIVHLHSVYLWPTSAAAGEAHQARVPYVISPRGMLVEELIRRKSRLAKRSWLALVERRNFGRAAAIHFTSQREWNDASRVGLPLPRPFVVPNGIDPPANTGAAPRDEKLIVFVGRLNWKKGIDRLIEAMPMIPEARLEIAGNDEESYEPRLRGLADGLGVSNRVRFLGPVSGAEKESLLHRAAVFALPSMSENFGNAVLEAMAATTPVVVTPEVGLADDVARANAGIVTSSAPADLAAAINRLLSDPSEREAMGRRGHRLVSSRFVWPQVAAAMELHYLQCTTGR
jgi:glycosyltransferase involved in cell wall biosynthesis